MSLIIHDQSLFVKNSDTNEFIPISMFSSGADQALNQIAEAAQAAKDGVDDLNNKILQNKMNIISINSRLDSLDVGGFRILFVSDLHYYAEHPESNVAGHTERERMQMLVNAIIAEHQKKKLSAVFILGDFERGYGKTSAEYVNKHYLVQLGDASVCISR